MHYFRYKFSKITKR